MTWSEGVNNDGSFRLQGFRPSTLRVTVGGLAETAYVKAINYDGHDVNGKDLDLASSAKLEENLHQNIEPVLILKEALDVEAAKIR